MKDSFTVSDVTVDTNSKYQGYLPVYDTGYAIPVTIINGKEDGKVFVASSGVHGCEYPGIQALVELANEIQPADVSGAIIFVHLCNVEGFYGRQPYVVPNDEERKNLNRCFPGNKNGTLADKIAAFIGEEIIEKTHCDFHADLHGGDITEELEACCICCAPKMSENCLYAEKIAKCLNFKWRMYSGGRTECYNSSAIDKNVPSILMERAGRGDCSREDIDLDKEDVTTIMKYLKILPGEVKENPDQKFFDKHEWAEADVSGLLYRYAHVGEDVKEGQKLCDIYDIFGSYIESVYALFDGHMVISTATLSVKKGDDLFTYGHIQE